MSTFNYELAATVLVDAAYTTDTKAAEKHDVSERSVRRWRNRLDRDEKLASLVLHKKRLAEQDWATELAPAIRASIDYLRRAAETADTSDPDVIHAVAGALKMLTSVALTKKVLDDRLSNGD